MKKITEKNDIKNNEQGITVHDLILFVNKLSASEYKNNSSILTALKIILNWHKKNKDDFCNEIFDTSFDNYKKILNEIFSSYIKTTKNKYIYSSVKIYEYYKSINKKTCLPDSFTEAIQKVHAESNMTFYQISKKTGICNKTIANIVTCKTIPNNYKTIMKLEKAYGLDPYTLLSKINLNKNDAPINREDFPSKFLKQKSKITPHLKNLDLDFKHLSTEKKEEICDWIMNNIVVNNNEYSKKHLNLSQEKYKYNTLKDSPKLKNELELLTKLKTSKIPLINLKRKSIWKNHTLRINIDTLLYFFGWINNHSQYNIEKNDYSLILILNKELIHKYISWRLERRGEMCVSEIDFLKLLASLLNTKFGLLPQAYDLFFDNSNLILSTLKSKPSQTEWQSLCIETRNYYTDLWVEIETTMKQTHVDRNGIVKKSRDPFLPIKPILDDKQPLKKYLELLCNVRNNYKNGTSSKKEELTFYTGYLSAMILLQSALRANNALSLLTTDIEDSDFEAIIIKENEIITDIPAQFVKNNIRNYCSIVNTHNLYNDIMHYINLKKEIFKETCSYFFVTKHNSCYTTSSFSKMISSFTKKYIAYNKYKKNPGIFDLQSHGPHAFRDIIATHVIKTTGSYSLAALAINDSESTVKKHYARFLPNDKNNIIKKITNEIFNI